MKIHNIVLIIYGVIAALFGVSEVRQASSGSEAVYTVERMRHNFKPDLFPAPYFGASNYEFSAKFDSTCWWSSEDPDYNGGNDIKDWNKLGGLTSYLSPSNVQSVMIAWRPAPDSMMMEITAYRNGKNGDHKWSKAIKAIPVDSSFNGSIKFFGNTAYYTYLDTTVSMDISKPFVMKEIGPWFGGNQRAHRAMSITLARKVY